jgi:outer membrane protein OmpA-like peptidoglycan-associated protein
MKKTLLISTLIGALALQGCATGAMQQPQGAGKSTAIGAVLGAAAGAIIGSTTGSDHVARDAVIGAAVGGLGGYVWNNQMAKQQAALETATAGTGIDVQRTADNRIKMDIPADAGFATNQAMIQPRLQTVLNTVASTLNANNTTVVYVVGHTDSSGSDAINYPLSQRRAESTRNYLVNKGVSGSRFTTEGKAATQPVSSNDTVAGRADNRRVEIFVGQPAS